MRNKNKDRRKVQDKSTYITNVHSIIGYAAHRCPQATCKFN